SDSSIAFAAIVFFTLSQPDNKSYCLTSSRILHHPPPPSGAPTTTATTTSSTGASPTGGVVFSVTRPNGSVAGTFQFLSSLGTASISLPDSPLQAGTYTISAQYSDSSIVFADSAATPLSQVVNPPLSITAPADVMTFTGAGATTCGATLPNGALGTPTTSGATGAVTITRSPSGNAFAVGTTPVTWTATDAAGNT